MLLWSLFDSSLHPKPPRHPARGGSANSLRSLGILGGVLLVALAGAAPRAAHAVPIKITYTDSAGEGFNDATLGAARRNAFEAAASRWSQLLPGTVTVVISASMDSLGGDQNEAILGSAGPNDFLINASGLQSGIYYPVALANQLAGQDLNQGAPEIVAQFNSDVDNATVLGTESFYYGTDGNPPGDDIDFYTTVLHEFCHGLGFIDGLDQNGSYYLGGPDIFDTFEATGPALNATRLTTLSQSDRAAAIISDALYFAGPQANAAGGGVNAKLYAPNPYSEGSSVGHLDEDTYHGINELMTPYASSVAHDPGPVTLGIMHDIGWANRSAPTPTPIRTPVPGSATPTPSAAATPTPSPLRRPANDNFANAQGISGSSGQVKGTNVNATKELGEPIHSPDNTDPGGASVWYRWAAPGTGKVTFTTAGSGFDTVLAVYTGSSVSGLTALPYGKNDDISATVATSGVTVNVTQGTVYHIAVDGYYDLSQGGVRMGSVVLNWSFTGTTATATPRPTVAPTPKPTVAPTPVPTPANNNFANAQVLSGTKGYVVGTNIRATKERGEPVHAGNGGGKSVWYRWIAPASGSFNVSTVGSNFDTLLAIYTGSSVNALTQIGQSDNAPNLLVSSVTINVTGGLTYQIAVDGKNTSPYAINAAEGKVVLNWTFKLASALVSNAQLSTASANSVTGFIALRFGGALNEAAASAPTSYAVMVNGTPVVVESAAYAASSHTVTLALPENALRFGDKVTASWKLTDAKGHALAGRTGSLTAR